MFHPGYTCNISHTFPPVDSFRPGGFGDPEFSVETEGRFVFVICGVSGGGFASMFGFRDFLWSALGIDAL